MENNTGEVEANSLEIGDKQIPDKAPKQKVEEEKEPEFDFEEEFKHYLHQICYVKRNDASPAYNEGKIEYFGVLAINDPRHSGRKLWYLYNCKRENIDETVDRLRNKFGKKNTWEIFREHTFSGADLRARVKKYFIERKFQTKGNFIEAPFHEERRYTDERIVKAVTEQHNYEKQKLYNYLLAKHTWHARFVR